MNAGFFSKCEIGRSVLGLLQIEIGVFMYSMESLSIRNLSENRVDRSSDAIAVDLQRPQPAGMRPAMKSLMGAINSHDRIDSIQARSPLESLKLHAEMIAISIAGIKNKSGEVLHSDKLSITWSIPGMLLSTTETFEDLTNRGLDFAIEAGKLATYDPQLPEDDVKILLNTESFKDALKRMVASTNALETQMKLIGLNQKKSINPKLWSMGGPTVALLVSLTTAVSVIIGTILGSFTSGPVVVACVGLFTTAATAFFLIKNYEYEKHKMTLSSDKLAPIHAQIGVLKLALGKTVSDLKELHIDLDQWNVGDKNVVVVDGEGDVGAPVEQITPAHKDPLLSNTIIEAEQNDMTESARASQSSEVFEASPKRLLPPFAVLESEGPINVSAAPVMLTKTKLVPVRPAPAIPKFVAINMVVDAAVDVAGLERATDAVIAAFPSECVTPDSPLDSVLINARILDGASVPQAAALHASVPQAQPVTPPRTPPETSSFPTHMFGNEIEDICHI